jgi:hypothetical protein
MELQESILAEIGVKSIDQTLLFLLHFLFYNKQTLSLVTTLHILFIDRFHYYMNNYIPRTLYVICFANSCSP